MAAPTRATTLTRDYRLVTLHSTDLAETYETAASIEDRGGQVMHLYGPRVMIGRIPGQQTRSITARSAVDGIYAAPVRSAPAQLSPAEALGLAAWNLRQSSPYQRSKARRPRDGDLLASLGRCCGA